MRASQSRRDRGSFMKTASPSHCAWSTGDVVERRLLKPAFKSSSSGGAKATMRTSAGTGEIPQDGRLATMNDDRLQILIIISAGKKFLWATYKGVVVLKWLLFGRNCLERLSLISLVSELPPSPRFIKSSKYKTILLLNSSKVKLTCHL